MIKFIRKRLMLKLIIFFLLVALIPIGILGYLSFNNAKQALQKIVLNDLSVSRDTARANVLEYFQHSMSDARYLGKNPGVQSSFKALNALLNYALLLDYAKANPMLLLILIPTSLNGQMKTSILCLKDFWRIIKKRGAMKMFS